MEKQKTHKNQYGISVEINKLFHHGQNISPRNILDRSQNSSDGMFLRYASSIIQVVPQNHLEKSDKFYFNTEHPQPIYETSQLNNYNQTSSLRSKDIVDIESNKYYKAQKSPYAKKSSIKQVLAYNFTNFAHFCSSVNQILKKPVKNSFQIIKLFHESHKNIKMPKKTSFSSNYTSSTGIDDRINKLSCKSINKKQEQVLESANLIKGWIQFKMRIIYSMALQQMRNSIKSRKSITSNQLGSVNICFEEETSMNKDVIQQAESSLVYTADNNFQFSHRQINLATPEKMISTDESKIDSPPFKEYREIKTSKLNSNKSKYNYSQASSVEPYILPPLKSKPLQLNISQQRRYLLFRTNIFELPIMSQHYIKSEKQLKKDLTVNRDNILFHQPQITIQNENLIKDGQNACQKLLKNRVQITKNELSAIKNIQSKQINESYNYFDSKIENSQSRTKILAAEYSNTERFDRKHTQIIFPYAKANELTSKKQTKATKMIDNYYFAQQNSPKLKERNGEKHYLNTDKIVKPNQEGIESAIDMLQSKSPNAKQKYRIQQSLVNGIFPGDHKLQTVSDSHRINLNQNLKPKPQIYQNRFLTNRVDSDRKVISMPKMTFVSYNKMQPVITNQPLYQMNQTSRNHQKLQTEHRQHQNLEIRSPNKNIMNYYATSDKQIKNYNSNQLGRETSRQFGGRPQSKSKYGIPISHQINHYQLNQGVSPTRYYENNHKNIEKKNNYHPFQKIEAQTHKPQVILPHQSKLANNYERTSNQKVNIYSPNAKDNNLFRPKSPVINFPKPLHNQQYFPVNKHQSPSIPAVSFNNNYYISQKIQNHTPTPQHISTMTQNPSIVTENRSMSREREMQNRSKNIFKDHQDRPSRIDRTNIFSQYGKNEFERQAYKQERSSISRNSSQISRPKSMNEKIHVTLKRDR